MEIGTIRKSWMRCTTARERKLGFEMLFDMPTQISEDGEVRVGQRWLSQDQINDALDRIDLGMFK